MRQIAKTASLVVYAALFFLSTAGHEYARAGTPAVPQLEDYNHPPLFQTTAIAPNIMVILDNSGSMNWCVYGTYPYPYDMSEVTDEPYAGAGAPKLPTELSCRVQQESDCGEEDDDENAYVPYIDLELGRKWCGLRFSGVQVPQGAEITNAYIEFTASETTGNDGTKAVTIIYGEKPEGTPSQQFSNAEEDISDRERTDTSVEWEITDAWYGPSWWGYHRYRTNSETDADHDVKDIVSEITSHEEWNEGDPMTFIFKNESGCRRAFPHRPYGGYGQDRRPRLVIEYLSGSGSPKSYFGYFLPDRQYTYVGDPTTEDEDGYFKADPNGKWSGNWLNWMCMRRLDVLRLVLVGGKADARNHDGETILEGTDPEESWTGWYREFDASQATSPDPLTPYGSTYRYYAVDGGVNPEKGYLLVHKDDNIRLYSADYKYAIRVLRKESEEPPGSTFFRDNEVSGVLQKVGDKARWGNMWFYRSGDGGGVQNPIGTDIETMVDSMEEVKCETPTPLGETYYCAMRYFMEDCSEHHLFNDCNGWYDDFDVFKEDRGGSTDPYKYDGYTVEDAWCAGSYVLYLTDGAPTDDEFGHSNTDLPPANTDEDSHETDRHYNGGGSDRLDDLAYYARIHDMRDDIPGEQNLLLYVVYAFGNDDNARLLLNDAAINGGFVDIDGDNKPDSLGDPRGGGWSDLGTNEEWDADMDNSPDTYFEAPDGAQLEQELLDAIYAIINRASSASAVSVLATRGEGEGSIVQAYYRPSVGSINQIDWAGYIQSLWVDRYGNIREDTNQNKRLDLADDNIIKFMLDNETREPVVQIYDTDAGSPYQTTSPSGTKALEDINALWKGGEKLAQREAATRRVFTSVGASSHLTGFARDNATLIGPYLGVNDSECDDDLSYLGSTYDDRVNNLICFTRGEDPDSSSCYSGSYMLRRRTDDDGNIWKLGDIVNSTPATVQEPMDAYGSIYRDQSYVEYYRAYSGRETVVYVGANDGMLHAFTGGWYNSDNQSFHNVYDVSGYLSDIPDAVVGNIDIGEEMWAYIPKNLLPHLKWLASTDYDKNDHIDFVDLSPKVVDARVFSESDKHPNGWGTVLIGGMNMGGGEIQANGQIFGSTYFAIDITNPRDPELMWELDPAQFSHLGYTTNQPGVLSVGNTYSSGSWSGGQWMLVLGSGPTDYDGESSQSGHLYIIDLATGAKLRDITASPGVNSYLNTPVGLDKGMNYNVDGIYYAVNYEDSGWKSMIQKLTIPQNGTEFSSASTDYDTTVSNWYMHAILEPQWKPITAPFTLSVDKKDNVWVYGGTGKFMSWDDKTNMDQQYLFGFKDPFFNYDADNRTNCYHDFGKTCAADSARLYDAGQYEVFEDHVDGLGGSGNTFNDLLQEARDAAHDGWYRELCAGSIDATGDCLGAGSPSERMLKKASIIGGLLLIPTFAPNSDPCGCGGNSRAFALYYETGTAYRKSVVGQDGSRILDTVPLGEGMISSMGIHVGHEEGGTGYVQRGPGLIQEIPFTPPFSIKSGPFLFWQEDE